MSRGRKIAAIVGGSIAGLLLFAVVAGILVVRTAWFQEYVRTKIVASMEEATGGRVEIGSFRFELAHLRAVVLNLVLHGLEAPHAAPLFRADLVRVDLKLTSPMKGIVDIAYLLVQRPQGNVIVYPDGRTNIPAPKTPKKSNKSGLQTIVDLAVGRFELRDGSFALAERKMKLDASGRNLRAHLDYDAVNPGYQGQIDIDPLDVKNGANPAVPVRVTLPLVLRRDEITLTNARIGTPQSEVMISGKVGNLAAAARGNVDVNASVSLPEIQRVLGLGKQIDAAAGPRTARAVLAVALADNRVQIRRGQVVLGASRVDVTGTLQSSGQGGAAEFRADLALGELGRLLRVAARPEGQVHAAGNATLGANGEYRVTGNVEARNASVQANATRISGINLDSHIAAAPNLLQVSGLKLSVEGGSLTGDATLANMQNLQFTGNIRDFSLQALSRLAGSKDIGYSGVISGPVRAKGDVKSPQSIDANANLAIAAARGGIPVSGQLNVTYSGAAGVVNVDHSRVNLPHTNVNLTGSLGRQIDVHAVSRDLRDLAPLAPSLPVTLEGGGSASVDASIRGNLSAPQINAHAALNNFAVRGQRFTRFAGDVQATPSEATVSNATLSQGTLQANLSGAVPLKNWKPDTSLPLRADLSMRGADVKDLLALAGNSDLDMTGTAALEAHITGSMDDPRGNIDLTVVQGKIQQEPFDRIAAQAVLSAGEIRVPTLEVAAGPSRLDANAVYRHPQGDLKQGTLSARATSSHVQLAQFQTLVKNRPGLQGVLDFNAAVIATLQQRNGTNEVQLTDVNGNFAVHGMQMQGRRLGDLTARASTVGNAVQYDVHSDFAGSTIRVNGRSLLTAGHETNATAAIQGLPIERVLALAGRSDVPVRGTLSTNAQLSGTLADPHATGNLTVTKGAVYGEPIDRFETNLTYNNRLIDVSSLRVEQGPARVELSASYNHAPGDLRSGAARFQIRSNRIDLAHLHAAQQDTRRLGGTAEISAEGVATLRANAAPLVSALTAKIGVRDVRVNGRPAGAFTLDANTSGGRIAFKLDSDLAGANVRGSGTVEAGGDYAADAKLSFVNVTYARLQPLLGDTAAATFDALVSGDVSVSGPLARPAGLNGEVRLTTVDVHSVPAPGTQQQRAAFSLRNNGPMVARMANSVVTIQNARLEGKDTSLSLTGSARVGVPESLDLHADGRIQLGLLEAIDPNIFSGGTVILKAAVTGTAGKPQVNGTLQLQDAALHTTDAPTGLSKGNGTIRFTGTDAVIQNLTGELGGGKVTLTGTVAYGGPEMRFRVQAGVDHARVEYPQNVSTEASAQIALTGTEKSSLVSGNVTIHGVALYSHSDIGTALSSAAAPPPSSAGADTGMLAGMRLDVRIRTAPDTQIRTTLTQNMQVAADLRLRGTPAQPGMLGHADVTQGDAVFFGTKYSIQQGVVRFYDPNRINPVLNIDLQTKVQEIEVDLRVTGPMDRLKLTYHSDPPLEFSDIVSLLATGKANVSDPVIAARQPVAPQQSFEQMGASAVLGQAVANPVSGRLQRLFGVSKLKIDPKLVSGSTVPQATVTMQQQITPSLTFTYIQDVTQTNPQTVRVEWSINPEWSAVAQRDYTGAVEVDLFYKRRFW